MDRNRKIINKRNIRTAQWYEEVAEYFGINETLLKTAVSPKRLEPGKEPPELKEARETIRKTFMPQAPIQLHDRILNERTESITDIERSSSWRDYIFVCINGEKRSFERMNFFNLLANGVVATMLKSKEEFTVLDYGCGSSLFTRILSQNFRGRVKTISADVCKPAIEFSVARNKLYNSNATGILIEDVMSFPALKDIDMILADRVFEHLPNSTQQIQGLIDSLSLGGILIENYSGHSKEIPHKSDTFDSYKSRDKNLDLLNNQLTLFYGIMPECNNGIYGKDLLERYWVNGDTNHDQIKEIRMRLGKHNSFIWKLIRGIRKVVN
jgi:SAM-dependent methyltransferase